jgi:transcriptional regulator with GAF, ATPase, and Fis domain
VLGRHHERGELPLELSITQLGTEHAELFAVFIRDITERKQTEQARQRAFDEVASQKSQLEGERDYLREELSGVHAGGELVGRSPALLHVLELVESVAGTSATVLIRGESGVGKELIARAIHAESRRASGPLVKVNCASTPRELFESEVFGHVRGAFTGAHKDRIGRFELAHRGTLFLDEVGEIPLELQAKLLRVLQESAFERVGDDRTRSVDVRVIAASNRDLGQEVAAGRFRTDLFYRLSVFPIEVPPLRERTEDIVPLAEHFLRLHQRALGRTGLVLDDEQQRALLAYDWPGNVRELDHVIERAVILAREGPLQLGLAPRGAALPQGAAEARVLRDAELRGLERDNLVAALTRAAWRVGGPGGAAELLGMSPSTLRDRMKAFAIERPKPQQRA